jgi:nucleoside-diphosphate-sugar epimerase
MKILILGGAGFIGHNVAKELHSLDHDVLVYDSFASYFPETQNAYLANLQIRLGILRDSGIPILRGEVTDYARLLFAVREYRPDVIIHLANIPVSTASNRFSKEAIDINLRATTYVIDVVRSVPSVKRLVYASSSYVYGDFQYEPVDEKHPFSPIDTYGATKAASEFLIRGIGKRFGLEYVIVRPSAVYGPTGSNGAVSQLFIENAILGKPLKLHNGGAARVDFTYVTDTAHGLVLAALVPDAANEIFNITRGEGRSLKEYAGILRRYVPDLTVEEAPQLEPIPKRGSLDISKARAILGYEPKYSLEEGIKEYYEFAKAHLKVPEPVTSLS